MLNIDIKPYSALPCELEVFRINSIKADIDDFGNNYDANPEIADEYCCGCHKFVGFKKPNENTLLKYKIDKEDFYEIVDKLENILYVGSCGWCS